MLITRDDIQRIGDEETLLHFLGEKLNLPIPEEATLEQIALPLLFPFLGLSEPIVEQIKDFRDLSGNPKNALGKRRPFLIQFRSSQNYTGILRDVAKNLNQKYADPADVFFICVAENFQPFAFAYFNDSPTGDWHTASLNILAWTQENTNIQTSFEHELPTEFFPDEPIVRLDSTPEDEMGFEEEDDFSPKNVPSDESEDDTLEMPDVASPDHIVKRGSSEDLLAKLENSGTSLDHFNVYEGVTIRYNEAFRIRETKRQQLIREDAKSDVIIKSQFQLNQKWQATSTPLIYIPNSENKSWPWSGAGSEVEAENVFTKSYPAVSRHLKGYRDQLRTPKYKGKFYWELPSYEHHSEFKKAKIVCPYSGNSMRACYDRSGAVVLRPAFFIPTEDLSLLAILNSKLFDWYVKAKYHGKGPMEFKQSNITCFPVAAPTTGQKSDTSYLVQQILNDPDNLEIVDIEQQIDDLVYELYELTDAEITLIEEETSL